MSNNGMGGRRVGKKFQSFYDGPLNTEEGADFQTTPPGHGRLSDWEQLIADYNRQNQFIRAQKRKWLPPKKRKN